MKAEKVLVDDDDGIEVVLNLEQFPLLKGTFYEICIKFSHDKIFRHLIWQFLCLQYLLKELMVIGR